MVKTHMATGRSAPPPQQHLPWLTIHSGKRRRFIIYTTQKNSPHIAQREAAPQQSHTHTRLRTDHFFDSVTICKPLHHIRSLYHMNDAVHYLKNRMQLFLKLEISLLCSVVRREYDGNTAMTKKKTGKVCVNGHKVQMLTKCCVLIKRSSVYDLGSFMCQKARYHLERINLWKHSDQTLFQNHKWSQ